MMRIPQRLKYPVLAAAILSVAGCGQDPGHDSVVESQDLATGDVAEMADGGASRQVSDIGPSAAPGVAFDFRYAFRLANNRIAAVQEEHAAACEALGVNRCRITGMRYRLVNDQDIEAMLAFRLDPAAAREFGKKAGAAVTKAEGMIVDVDINAWDAGQQITDANVRSGRIEDDIAELDKQLQRPGLSNGERAQLTAERDRLRQALRATRDSGEAAAKSLATTPVVFNYGSGEVVPGFADAQPLSTSFRHAGALLMNTFGFFIVALGALIPWILVVVLLWFAWPQASRVVRSRLPAETATAA